MRPSADFRLHHLVLCPSADFKSFPELFSVFETRQLLIVCGIVVVCGVLLCVVSTYFVVNKLVAASKDDLYY